MQCYLAYDNSDHSYRIEARGRSQHLGCEVYRLGPGEVEHLGPRIDKRFTVKMTSGVAIQVELYHDEDVEELMGFLEAGLVNGTSA